MIASTFARVGDRLRPWSAPASLPSDAPCVAVIGAGPAGLATAALLRRANLRPIVFDGRDQIGGSWPDRYDSLRLNTVRWMSDLPGYRMRRPAGRWVRRDDLVEYLRAYAEHHHLEVQLGRDARVERIDRAAGGWTVGLPGRSASFGAVVVATGHSLQPVTPDWPGAADFEGRLIHASEYRRPADHAGAHVLVVGAGSSGGEVCVDLAAAGMTVTWAVRSAPRVFPREVLHVPATPVAPVADALPDRLLDRAAPWVERRIYGPRDYLPEPRRPMMELLAHCKEPMTADGIVEFVRNGSVRVVDAVVGLHAGGAKLGDGTSIDADHVIAATGYRPGLEPLVGHLDVLNGDGRPRHHAPLTGLGFVGFRIPFTGTLWAIEQDARAVAATIARTT